MQTVAISASALLLWGCGDDAPRESEAAPPLYSIETDQQIVEDGLDALVYDFRTQRRLYKGRGWFPPEDLGEWGSWTEIRAQMYFAPPDDWTPGAEQLDLVARAAPFNYPGAPTQKLGVTINGTRLDPVPLEARWQDVRFSLPARALKPGINRLIFEFDHATRPVDVLDSQDRRALGGSFSRIHLEAQGDKQLGARATDEAPAEVDIAPPSVGDEARPPIFVYLIDTLRADSLEIYGSERSTSPRFTEFARDAVVFERAWSTSAWTLPATLSLLTGLHPHRHGFSKASITKRPEHDLLRLPEILRSRGYETLAISQTYVAGLVYGFDEGFDSFYVNDSLGFPGQYTDNVRWFFWQHLRNRSDGPLFTYVHTVAPHNPYDPSGAGLRWVEEHPRPRLRDWLDGSDRFEGIGRSPSQIDHAKARYDGEVYYADEQFGIFLDLLRRLGVYDDSLIVVTSDHGEEFFEHEGFYHSRTLYEELLRVPLLIKLPKSRHGGLRVTERASLVDIAPTIADVLTQVLEAPPEAFPFEGRSLLPLMDRSDEGRGPDEPRPVFAETAPEGSPGVYADVDIKAMARGDVKCIWNRSETDRYFQQVPEIQVFDLRTDSAETQPLAPTDERARVCLEDLRSWAEAADAVRLDDTGVEALSPEERARLEALGYL